MRHYSSLLFHPLMNKFHGEKLGKIWLHVIIQTIYYCLDMSKLDKNPRHAKNAEHKYSFKKIVTARQSSYWYSASAAIISISTDIYTYLYFQNTEKCLSDYPFVMETDLLICHLKSVEIIMLRYMNIIWACANVKSVAGILICNTQMNGTNFYFMTGLMF